MSIGFFKLKLVIHMFLFLIILYIDAGKNFTLSKLFYSLPALYSTIIVANISYVETYGEKTLLELSKAIILGPIYSLSILFE